MASQQRNHKFDTSLYVLAERLHMPVYKIRKEMPLYEFIGWLRYFNGGDKPAPVDLTTVGKDQLARMFG
jgi:hypothetical protein